MPEQQVLRHPKTLKDALRNINNADKYDENSVSLIICLISKIRPVFYGDYQRAENSLKQLILMLENNPTTLRKLRYLTTQIIVHSEILEIFTSSGIETDINFFTEFKNRFKHKILPVNRKEDSMLRLIDLIFYKNTDIRWIEKVDPKTWEKFFSILKL